MTIAEVVEPLRSRSVARAEQFARSYVNGLMVELEYAGGDAQVAAPYPSSSRSTRNEYIAGVTKYKMVRRLTRPVGPQTYRPSDPDIRTPDEGNIEAFVKEAREEADAQYSAFIAKLEAKVGAHSDAKLIGDHVWGHSILTVDTPSGRQNWKTQQIINVSKLGKVFNQWPTREVK